VSQIWIVRSDKVRRTYPYTSLLLDYYPWMQHFTQGREGVCRSTILITVTSSVNFDVIFGPAHKGISFGAVRCATLYNDIGIEFGFVYGLKEAKDHGEGGKLVDASMGECMYLSSMML